MKPSHVSSLKRTRMSNQNKQKIAIKSTLKITTAEQKKHKKISQNFAEYSRSINVVYASSESLSRCLKTSGRSYKKHITACTRHGFRLSNLGQTNKQKTKIWFWLSCFPYPNRQERAILAFGPH